MGFSTDHRTPAQLTGIARGTIEGVYGASVVSDFLPFKATDSLTYSFDANTVGLPEAAKFRSYNTGADVAHVTATGSTMGQLPPISRTLPVDEYSQLKLTGGDLGGVFEEYARRIATQIAVRLVQASADALTTGKVTIAERGLNLEVDFGRKQELSATAANLWNAAGADILGDLETLRAVYRGRPGRVHVPRRVLDVIARNTEFIKLALGRGTDLPSRISEVDVLSTLARFGFENVFTADEKFLDTQGVERNVFPSDHVVFLPGGVLDGGFNAALAKGSGNGSAGNCLFGITAEALSEENGIGRSAGAAAGVLKRDNPVGYDVLVSAIALPVLTNANATASLRVL